MASTLFRSSCIYTIVKGKCVHILCSRYSCVFTHIVEDCAGSGTYTASFMCPIRPVMQTIIERGSMTRKADRKHILSNGNISIANTEHFTLGDYHGCCGLMNVKRILSYSRWQKCSFLFLLWLFKCMEIELEEYFCTKYNSLQGILHNTFICGVSMVYQRRIDTW